MDKQQQLEKLIKDFDNAMLVTPGIDGLPHARPLHIAKVESNGTFYFLVSAPGEVASEIADGTKAAVVLQGSRKFVSLSGTCRVSQDKALIDSVWTPAAAPWYEQGRDDPNVAVVVFSGQHAEYWAMESKHLLRFPIEFIKGAAIRGESINPDKVGIHEEVRLQ